MLLKTLWKLSKQLERLSTVDKVMNISTSTRIDNINGFLEIDDLQQKKDLDDGEIESIRNYLINNPNIKYPYVQVMADAFVKKAHELKGLGF